MSRVMSGWSGRAVAVAVAAAMVWSAPAVAGPVRWETATWNQPVDASAGRWFTTTDLGASVVGRADAAYPAQAYLEAGYCNAFGPNTHIVGMSISRTRWHGTGQDMNGAVLVFTPARRYLGVEGGSGSIRTTQRYLKNMVLDGIDLELRSQVPAVDTYRFPGGRCVASRVAVRGNNDAVVDTPGFVPRITQRLKSVLVEDLQGPAVVNLTAPTGWITSGTVTVGWDSSDNRYRRGTTGTRVVGAGSVDLGNVADGRHFATASLAALSDGPQRVCAYRAGAGWAEAVSCRAIRIDRTDPATPAVGVAPDVTGFAAVPVTVVTDPVDDGSGSGWSHNQIRVDGGPWTTMGGVHVIDQDGVHVVQARAVDRAGRTSVPSAPRTIRVDRTAPTVTDVRTDGLRGTVRWTMADAGGFGSCVVTIALAGPGTNGALVTVAQPRAASFDGGAAQVTLPVGTMPNGQYDVHLTVCDGAGNTTTVRAPLGWMGNPDGVLTGSWARFVPMALTSPGTGRYRQLGGIQVPRIRRSAGGRFSVAGRLQRPDGSPFASAALEVRDGLGRYIGGFRTTSAGRFTVTLRARVGGAWTINTVGSRVRQPLAWLEVRPIVRARAMMRSGGRALVVVGRMTPGIRVQGKVVSLQWFDTLTRSWRPALDGRIRASGRFRLTYSFTRPGSYSMTIRAVVPRDAGWPYLTGVSRPMTVRVG